MSHTSNSLSFDCQDTGPNPTSQDPIKDTKDSEIGDPDVQDCVSHNSESNVEHGYSSGGGALMDIVDAPPIKKIQFEISEAFVSIIHDFILEPELHQMAEKCDAGFGMNIVEFWDILKRTMEWEFKRRFRIVHSSHCEAASSQISLATTGEFANPNIEMELVLQEILETFHKMNELVNKYKELFYSLLGHGNSESNVQHGDSSGCGAHADIVEAPPAKKIKFEISKAFVSIFRHFLADGEICELAKQCEAGFGMNTVEFQDLLKQTMEWRLRHYFKIGHSSHCAAASSQISLATPGELANLNIEMELVLQEILESFHKMNGSVNKYGELFSYRLSGKAKEERNREEYQRLEEDDESSESDNESIEGASLSPLPLFLEIMPYLLIPPMVFILIKILEYPITNSFIEMVPCVIVSCAIVYWLNSFLQ